MINFEKAFEILRNKYVDGLCNGMIRKPISWALYHTWREVDRLEKPRDLKPDVMEQIKQTICDEYCKFPGAWDADAEGCELAESDICKNCPLNRL